jgi:tetratricopeptide (TPR) repeat protein
MLAGRPILPRGSTKETRRAQRALQASLTKVLRIARKTPQAIQELLHALVQFDANQRPPDAETVKATLLQAFRSPLPTEELSSLVRQNLRQTAILRQKIHLKEARKSLQKHTPLPGACQLLEGAELTPLAGSRYRERLQRLLINTFWQGFLPPCIQGEECILLYQLLQKTTSLLEDSTLGALALVRLGELSEGNSPVQNQLPPLSHTESEGDPIAGYVQTLRKYPTDEHALLGLAVRTPDFQTGESTDLARIKASLLHHHELYQQALYYRVQGLFQDPDPLAALIEIRDFAQEGIAECQKNASLPEDSQPPKPTTIPLDQSGEALEVESFLELHLSDKEVPPRPPSSPGSTSIPPQTTSIDFDPEVCFTRGQILVYEGKFPEATKAFHKLQECGLLQQKRFASPLCAELRKVLWRTLAPAPEAPPPIQSLESVWDLARNLNLHSILPICESLLLRFVPSEERNPRLNELVRRAPTSLPLLQEVVRLAREEGDRATEARYRMMTAWSFLEEKDPEASEQILEISRTSLPKASLSPLLTGLTHLKEEIVLLKVRFSELLTPFSTSGKEDLALEACESLLHEHPNFSPALEKARELASTLQRSTSFTQASLQLTRRALHRGDPEHARRLLHQILENQTREEEDPPDEALLLLAAISPTEWKSGEPLSFYQVRVLREEGFSALALQLAHKKLSPTNKELPFFHLMIELCEECGTNPSSYYLSAGLIHLERREIDAARNHLVQAIENAPRIDLAIDQIMNTENVNQVFSPLDIARLRSRFPLA